MFRTAPVGPGGDKAGEVQEDRDVGLDDVFDPGAEHLDDGGTHSSPLGVGKLGLVDLAKLIRLPGDGIELGEDVVDGPGGQAWRALYSPRMTASISAQGAGETCSWSLASSSM